MRAPRRPIVKLNETFDEETDEKQVFKRRKRSYSFDEHDYYNHYSKMAPKLENIGLKRNSAIVRLSDEEATFYGKQREEMSDHDNKEAHSSRHKRFKRASSENYQIETAVFIDSEMYNFVEKMKKKGTKVVDQVEEIVFSIMNGVSHSKYAISTPHDRTFSTYFRNHSEFVSPMHCETLSPWLF